MPSKEDLKMEKKYLEEELGKLMEFTLNLEIEIETINEN